MTKMTEVDLSVEKSSTSSISEVVQTVLVAPSPYAPSTQAQSHHLHGHCILVSPTHTSTVDIFVNTVGKVPVQYILLGYTHFVKPCRVTAGIALAAIAFLGVAVRTVLSRQRCLCSSRLEDSNLNCSTNLA